MNGLKYKTSVYATEVFFDYLCFIYSSYGYLALLLSYSNYPIL